MNWQTISLRDLKYIIDYSLDYIKDHNPNFGEFNCPDCQGLVRYINSNDQLNIWCVKNDCINLTINN